MAVGMHGTALLSDKPFLSETTKAAHDPVTKKVIAN
jgi:hypothetical protein